MSQSEQQAAAKKPSLKKMIFLASLGLLIPIFLVSMAFLAVNSDAKNQEKYKQQQAQQQAQQQPQQPQQPQALGLQ